MKNPRNNLKIKPETILQRKSDLLFNQIDGEVVMLSIANNEYYGMDKIGSRIWKMLEQPVSFKNLIKMLCDEFNVSEQQCKKDTIEFLTKLSDKNLINTAGNVIEEI